MFEENMKLVFYVFNKRFKNFYDMKDDLIQEGNIGLLKACRTYDKTRGVPFSTYAYKCIKNEMMLYLKKQRYIEFEVQYTADAYQIDYNPYDECYVDYPSSKYNKTIKLLSMGYKQCDIVKMTGRKKQRLSDDVQKIREEIIKERKIL